MTQEEFNGHLIEMGASMKAFAHRCFPMTLKVESPAFHDDLYVDFRDDRESKVLVVAPRGHAKTSVSAEICPIHRILYAALLGKSPEFIVLVSKTRSHTASLLSTIKEHLTNNEAIRFYFGDFGPDTATKWSEYEIVLKNGTTVVALGTGSQTHGLKRRQQRPTMIILDDPEDDKNAIDKDAMDQNYTWFEKALVPAADPKRCKIIVIGTMINEGCLVDRLSKLPGWKVHWYKAIPDRMVDGEMKEWDGSEDWPVLWPAWMPLEKLLAEKERLSIAGFEHIWWMNYQNVFRTGANQPFKREFFRKWKGEVIKTGANSSAIKLEWAKDSEDRVIFQDTIIPINVFWGYDPASSEAATADCTAIEFWGMDAKKNCFLLWKFNKRVDPLAAADVFYEQAVEMCPVTGNIETIAAQETIRSYLRHKTNEASTWIPGLDKKNQPRSKKSERLLSELWRIRNGMTYVRDTEDDDFLSQASLYVVDKESQKDDMLDAWYYAVKDSWPCDLDHSKDIKELEYNQRKIATLGIDEDIEGGVTWMGMA